MPEMAGAYFFTFGANMKIIPVVTCLIWGFFLLGSWLFPGVLQQDAIQFFLTVLFSVFLPVSFWQIAHQEKKKYFSLVFVGMLIVNIFLLGMIIRGNVIMQQQVSAELNRGIDQELAEYLVTAATGKQRRIAARFIYQRHGVALAYKNASDTYVLYVANKADKKKFQENFFANNDRKLKRGQCTASLFTALVLLLIHVGLFIILLVFLVLYDGGEKYKGKRVQA
ncbi:MAG: hypothetical protein D3916_05020 [Candidatus Electrothrix sp. MAN1_4]|nr:hypothetical protein [Candidatus Electrothrix sp. MAN1_4]